ncbi:2-oxoisovalerate dehydrogenase subunit beta [Nocardiopsis terrae]|uniref:Pyruvate dehydrogenase E1 component beta subunit n=1 Tax=Nocardiopsis terrae TaxID=372655 RepID=A0ABR9HEC4_9ACTN|nr:alpha-ketoacid dehydrogenase subunit beta [Nocardiopsis terrae]MBE1457256.1 pyruvate dehydrogenase E1 component beta subunit [Nocardiopsis terrae]GHC91409.1 2-oxoisovalerate dehydrogenase subunit beta [Nocardiopsis terrae]
MTELIERADTTVESAVVELSMQQAINRALRVLLTEDPDVLVFGEDVGALGGVFRVTDGLQKEFGDQRVFDTPLAESAIMGMAVGLAMNGWRPVPELQFDGFAYPAVDQIVNQVARMNYRTRGAAPMPITLRLPSFGGIQAPEHHGESLEALFAHTPGLKVVAPSDPAEAYSLLLQSVRSDDPVVYMEPKARYWDRRPVRLSEPTDPIGTSRIVRPGRHATLVAWGAMVHRCVQVAELAAEDGVELEVLDLRWLKPIDAAGLAASVARTKRAVVVHEAPLTAGLGAEVAALITENCFRELAAPVQRVTGFDVPYPAGPLEPQYLPTIDRVLLAVQRTLEY